MSAAEVSFRYSLIDHDLTARRVNDILRMSGDELTLMPWQERLLDTPISYRGRGA